MASVSSTSSCGHSSLVQRLSAIPGVVAAHAADALPSLHPENSAARLRAIRALFAGPLGDPASRTATAAVGLLRFHATDPDQLAEAIVAEVGREVNYRQVETDGAQRAARMIAELL